MPPTRRSNRVASSTAPGSQRNDRRQARAPRRRSRSTRGESSQTATIAKVVASVAPAVSYPTPTARQVAFPEDLITALVSSVTTAVTQHLSVLLPSPSVAPSTNSQSLSTTYPVVQSVSSDHAVTLVQDALGDVHSTLSGHSRPFNLTEQLPAQTFHSACLPLDARVPEKIKEKVWREEFVDFGVLLRNQDLTARYELKLGPSPAGQPASPVLEPTAKSKHIRHINDWLRAFHILVSIHTQRYLHETPSS